MSGQCAVLAAMRDLDDIYKHMGEFCMGCTMAKLASAGKGQEHIFTDRQPTWIAERQALAAAREAEERAEREKEVEMERKRRAMEWKKERSGEGTKINRASTDDEKLVHIRKLAGELSDKHLDHEIKKMMNVDESEAAHMRVELKREVARKKKEKEREKEKAELKEQIKLQKEEQKEKNPEGTKEILSKHLILEQKRPWQPPILKGIAIGDERRSALSVEEQKRLVAILSNYHHVDKGTRFEQNRKDLRLYDERLAEERVIVEGLVRAQLETTNITIKHLQTEIEHVLQRWATRYLNDQRRFEKMKTLPWKKEAEPCPSASVLKPILERLLMAAPNPKLMLPLNMHDRLHVAYTSERFDPRAKKIGTSIGNDAALLSLCLDTGCTIAMECTTAVHLMARPGEPRNYAYNIPLSVIEQFRGGSAVQLCLLGKPRPQSGISNQTLLHMVAKYRAKSTYTKQEVVTPSKPGTSRDTVAAATDTVVTKEQGGGGGDSLLDNLLGSILLPSSSVLSGGVSSNAAKPSTTDHSYGLFSIPSYTQPETKVIIRSSPCLRNEATGGTEYSLSAKVEFAAEAGVMRETFEQMLWNSMKAVFKGAVNSAIVHVHPYMKDALQISHSRAVPQGTHLNEEFFPLLSTRTEHFSRLLGELQQLQPGEYILQVSPLSDEITVFRENPTGNEMFFRKAPIRSSGFLKVVDTFTGIDDKRVLHWQVMQGRAPLSLLPEGHQMLKKAEAREKKEEGGGPVWKKNRQMTDEMRKRHNFMTSNRKKLNKKKKKKRGGGQGDNNGGQGWPRRDLDAPPE